ncbi:MAG TPA: hypothetical protein VNU65_12965 [Xanthobacteraceae bacterium]|nr:hypothetical protein [Xanthobacteraceae bacterium]
MINPEDWLTSYAPGYAALRRPEREAIAHFCLLWSLFEAQKMANDANAKRICDQVRQWELQGALNIRLFEKPLAYFRNRYFSHNEFTYHFHGLNFRPHDRQPVVESVLSGANHNAGVVVTALLLIAYRLRNNLFHGVKWGDELREQEANFKNANLVLMRALEIER